MSRGRSVRSEASRTLPPSRTEATGKCSARVKRRRADAIESPLMELRVMRTADLPGAVAVWHAANIARGKPPTPQRVARIIEKLQEPHALSYVAVEGDAIVGMALAEPCPR